MNNTPMTNAIKANPNGDIHAIIYSHGKLEQQLNDLLESNQWQPIETAPKEIGTYLVFLEDCKICMAFYNSNKQWSEMWSQQFLKVKHWQPLPTPPTTSGS